MRKHFLILMLLALLPLTSWAQFGVNNYVPKGNFVYKITQAAVGTTPGRVVLYGVRDGYDPVSTDSVLTLEGKITIGIIDGPSFDFVVDYANADALKNTFAFVDYSTAPTKLGTYTGMTRAKSVVIPKEFLTIKQNTFYGYTNMKSISFEANSEVTTIEDGAFNTTQIRLFDFSNCSKLTALGDGVFVEASPAKNSYVKTVKLPVNSTALTTIGKAFQRLTKLETIENLDQSLITKVEPLAFDGDASLKTLALPGTVEKIAATAFQGSGVENLTIDVTSMNNPVGTTDMSLDPAGNIFGTSKGNLKTLILKGVLSGELKPQAFQSCASLATVNMADMIITGGTIGESAFEGCTSLASLSFNAITDGTIAKQAFKGCTSLATLSFLSFNDVVIYGSDNTDGAFNGCTGLTSATFGESTDLNINTYAFYGCTKLNNVLFGMSTDLAIDASAFENFASAGSASTYSLRFGDATNLQIAAAAFKGASKLQTIQFGNIDDNAVGTEIAGTAFEGATSLKTLTFGDLTGVEIEANAFKGSTAATLTPASSATAHFGNLDASTIEAKAFDGCASLQTVEIGNVVNGSIIGDGSNPVFGIALKTVTIGTVESTATLATSIGAKAFTFANGSGATLNLAAGENEYLEDLTPLATPLVAAGAFDFSAVAVAAGRTYPVITIGELKSANTMAAGALKGNNIAKIVFAGDIAAGALNNMIITDNNDVVADLTLSTLDFNGAIGALGIAAGAFANLPVAMTINFNGKLAAGPTAGDEAIAAGAFLNLLAASEIHYTYTGSDLDKTANPFNKAMIDPSAASTRDIKLFIDNQELKNMFWDTVVGLGTNGIFELYRIDYVIPVTPDWTFVAYRNENSTTEAWARMKFGSEPVNASVPASDLKIQRVQTIDGIKVKLTIYGTYTDEDDANQKSTVYMVPLMAQGGYYYIPKTNTEVLIAKVEGASAFEDDVKVPVTALATAPATSSIWGNLTNTELHIAGNIMTNQQLVDGIAVDNNGTPGDTSDDFNVGAYIHNTAGAIYRHLYIMTNPASHKGFRFSVNDINDSNNVYINEGWYYMLLKNYGKTAAEAAAHIVWMDDATEGEITGILTVKDNAKNVAAKSEGIYTLQGVRVNEMQKGNIYIVNGKKYIAK